MYQFKNKFTKIQKRIEESNLINLSSTNLLNFYVNDLLDYAQINGGLFRQDCQNINIKDSIEEVMLVQKFKAESLGIHLQSKLVGFPLKEDAQIPMNGNENAEDQFDFIICTDKQRL